MLCNNGLLETLNDLIGAILANVGKHPDGVLKLRVNDVNMRMSYMQCHQIQAITC